MKIKDFSPQAIKLRNRLKRCQALLREFYQHRRERYRLTGNIFKVQYQQQHWLYPNQLRSLLRNVQCG